jgi:anti-sigma-K factor RskA
MDIQSFIQSGLLETYVLGQCTAEERALVERMVAAHAAVRAELASVEQALEGYANANAVAPPEWMKGRILDAIEDRENDMPETPDLSVSMPKPGLLRLFQAAAIALALLGAYQFYTIKQQGAEIGELKTTTSALQTQVDDCTRLEQRAEKLRQASVLLRDRDTRAVALDNGKATTYAYYNPVRREVALDLSGLQAPAPGKYFQFWAIVDGKPVNMGMVDLQTSDGWQMLPYLDNAVALAISQEDNPKGSPTPTVVVMVGNI